jgi:Fanconi anemia group M protein
MIMTVREQEHSPYRFKTKIIPCVYITADHRERRSGIPEILNGSDGIRVSTETLTCGDYIINGKIAVERKAVQDFHASIINKRVFRQAARMRSCFERSLIVVEGRNVYSSPVRIQRHAVEGAIISLQLIWQIPVLFSHCPEATADILRMAGNQYVSRNRWNIRPGQKPKRLTGRQSFILQGLPGVGPKLARRLLEHFGSIRSVFNSSESELASVHGIGREKAKEIVRIAGTRADDQYKKSE